MYIKTEFGAFEWDDRKAAINLAEHCIAFEEAMYVFNGPFTNTIDERFNYGETREISIGRIKDVLIITVVYTRRGGAKRIISVRPAKKKERAAFAAYIGRSA
jgi:uncharacterized DUF497 family protein